MRKRKHKERRRKEEKTKKRIIEIKKVVEEWEIWNKRKEAKRFKEEIKKLVS